MGVDRLSVSAPVSDFERDPRAWMSVADRLPGSPSGRLVYGGKVRVDRAESFVGVTHIRGTGQLVGKVEFNPSRVVDPEGYRLATVDESQEALRAAFDAAGELVTWACSVEDANLRRGDFARDFEGVADPAGLIRALAPIHKPWARRSAVYSDPGANGAQTHVVGSGAGSCRLYDKAVETRGRAPVGTVRYEAQCRSAWLARYGGMAKVVDLTQERARRMAEDRWKWSAMGVEIGATARVVEKVSRSDLSDREQMVFLGWLVSQAAGRGWSTASSRTLAKYRRLQRELGIAVSDLEAGGGATFLSRLDFDSGREITRVA